MNIDIQIVEHILHREGIFPDSIIERIDMGVMNYNFRFAKNSVVHILRISPISISNIEFEFSIMQKLFRASCLVPEPVLHSVYNNYPYLIYKHITGLPLADLPPSEYSKSINNDIVESVLKIASLDVSHFKDIIIRKQNILIWNSFLAGTIVDGKRYLEKKSNEIDFDIKSLFEIMQQKAQNIRVDKISLIWSDFNSENIIINNRKFAGFVDFEGCLIGDPILSLGYLFAVEGYSSFYKSILQSFQEKYKFSEDLIFFYTIFRIFRLAKYLDKPLPSGKQRDPLFLYFKGLKPALDKIKR